jgi:hypothetical protein
MMLEEERKHVDDRLPAFINRTLDDAEAGFVRDHLAVCSACEAAEREWRAIEAAAWAATAAIPVPSRGLLDRAWLKIDGESTDGGFRGLWHRVLAGGARPRLRLAAGSGALAAAFAGVTLAAVALTAFAGVHAQDLLNLFQPKQVVAIPTTIEDLNSLAQLSQYGTLNGSGDLTPQQATDPSAAAAASGFNVLVPANLPSSVSSSPSYVVLPEKSESFTFDQDKAQAVAQTIGKTLPPMPGDIAGTTLQVTMHPMVIAVYGGDAPALAEAAAGSLTIRQQRSAVGVADGAGPGAGIAGDAPRQPVTAAAGSDLGNGAGPGPLGLAKAGLPQLIVCETAAPSVTSSGASAAEFEQYLLSQPGISPQLSAAIKALGNPPAGLAALSILPVPVPGGVASAHSVAVQGTSGLAIGDSTGIGSAVLWQKNGMIYAVAGTLSEKDTLDVSNSLR